MHPDFDDPHRLDAHALRDIGLPGLAPEREGGAKLRHYAP
jgi:hypothetical protein